MGISKADANKLLNTTDAPVSKILCALNHISAGHLTQAEAVLLGKAYFVADDGGDMTKMEMAQIIVNTLTSASQRQLYAARDGAFYVIRDWNKKVGEDHFRGVTQTCECIAVCVARDPAKTGHGIVKSAFPVTAKFVAKLPLLI